ncbi:hypothetical protein INT45_005362 [Circinella minor]|uniref:Checkpoint protein RAD24-like helical bundle domain-containing protein n=1 Tax=Circinella minor TaxID=1195481 RepID=A0A8H7S032_9FUNG|nr:hypothetical protein INT45_005362 [Circinella minor]
MKFILRDRGERCLVLSGPAGSAKSTTIRTIAKTRDYKLVEWNQTNQEGWEADQEYQSNMSKFENFLHRASQYQPLSDPKLLNYDAQKRIILLDDIPDLTSDNVKTRFHELIEAYMHTSELYLMVIIVSEAWMQTDNNKWRGYNETRLSNIRDVLPPGLIDSPYCTLIELNPITPKRIEKSLNLIQEKEYCRTGYKLSKEQLTQIGELSRGDIRNAINMLQFHCIPPSLNSTKLPMKRKRDQLNNEKEKLIHAQERGSPLQLFHALGKVLYAKRDAKGQLESPPENIINLLPVDSNLFIAYLHENMAKFFENDIASYSKALEWIGLADTMTSIENWMDTAPSQYQLLLAMRGIMHSRTKPFVPGLFNRGLQVKNEKELESTDWNDDIENFSDEEFDDLFGDGTDIAELEGW